MILNTNNFYKNLKKENDLVKCSITCVFHGIKLFGWWGKKKSIEKKKDGAKIHSVHFPTFYQMGPKISSLWTKDIN